MEYLDADANPAVEDSAAAFASLMYPFMESMTAAITTAITNASRNAANIGAAAATDVRTVPKAVASISSSIDPFDNLVMDMNTREGKALWYTITRMPGAWPKAGVAVTVENSEALQDLIRDKVALYGLDRSMNIPTTGTVAVEFAPKKIGGKDYTNANLGNFVSFLDKIHQVTLVNVRSFEGWYFRGHNSKLADSSKIKIEPLDPNAIGNLGLANRQKIQMRQHSVIFHHLFKNAVSRSSYNSFFPDKKTYTYTKVVTGREIVGWLTLLKLMYVVIKPQLVVDHRTTEMLMEALTLSDCDNNVRTSLTNHQENVLEIDHLRGDGVTYEPQRFTTPVFDELVKTCCPDFLYDFKAERAKWIKRPPTFDMSQCIINLTALYTNYKHTGLWDKTVPNHKAQIIALATHFKEKMDAKKSTCKKNPRKSNPTATHSGAGKLSKCLFEDFRHTLCGPKKKNYAWCHLHGRKTDGVHSGMYMPAPHNHEALKSAKDAKKISWKE